jgi:RNA polymerase sigma factor (sigma-70 family)
MEASVNADAREGDQVERPMSGRGQRFARSTREDAIVFDALTTHAPALLRTARRHSLCADDAHDAYQRALEILLRRAGSLEPDRAINWLHTVIKHEAMAVRRSRQELVGGADVDLDREESSNAASPEERVIGWEHTTRAAEALKRLKPQERKALWLKATGLSYAEIADRESWTYTKVNRCLAEGRKSFLERYAGIESGAECERWAAALSALADGEATSSELAEVRPHLRNCRSCQATLRELHNSGHSITALIPIGLVGGGTAPPLAAGVGRLWESLVSAVAERATALAVKAQVAGDAVGGAKVAAVAATAVAVAGSGAAVVEQTHSGHHPQKLGQPASGSLSSDMRGLAIRVRRTVAKDVESRRSRAPEFSSSGVAADSDQVATEFGPEQSAPARSAPADSSYKLKSSSAQNGAEFDP